VKDNNGKECDGDARYDEIDGMEKSLASNGDVEGDIRLRFTTAVKALDVLASRYVQYIPFHATIELFEVDSLFDDVRDPRTSRLLPDVDQIHLQTR